MNKIKLNQPGERISMTEKILTRDLKRMVKIKPKPFCCLCGGMGILIDKNYFIDKKKKIVHANEYIKTCKECDGKGVLNE